MWKNYFTVAWRNLLKNKLYSLVNIAGLSTGMAVAMIIGLWIYDEVSANRQFKNYNQLYEVMMHQTFDVVRGTQQSQILAEVLRVLVVQELYVLQRGAQGIDLGDHEVGAHPHQPKSSAPTLR